KSICLPKIVGGLGIRLVEKMNQALLAKTSWELGGTSNSLWHSILSSKYLQNSTFWSVSPKPSDSVMWKDILKTKDLLNKGRYFQIFNGQSVNIWIDPWIPSLKNFKPTPIQGMNSIHPSFKVSDIIINNLRSWDIQKMQNLFNQTSLAEVLKILLSPRVQDEDKVVWSLYHNDKYLVKTAY
ncbi:hypothetical protein I3760_04G144500, partial [Carya illinoinensis]